MAVLDTGIDYRHPDLAANMWRNRLDCDGNGIDDDGNGYIDDCHGINALRQTGDPLDDNNHGSHVAGTIGAVGNNQVGVTGVNWNISLLGCKFLGADGRGTLDSALACLEYVNDLKQRGENIVATNNSWVLLTFGSSSPAGFSQALFDAVEEHSRSGILFIASAGNLGLDSDFIPTYPASNYLPNVLSVAATDSFDGLAHFSNYGRRTVHLGAPGESILSTLSANRYGTASGTSMATPHVAGVAALLKAFDSRLDWKAIKNLILAGGDVVPSLAGRTIAQRRLNARTSLLCSDSVVAARVSPVGTRTTASVGSALNLAALHIRCTAPNGEVAVVVNRAISS